VTDITGIAEAMARQVRNIGRPGVAAMAISAVDEDDLGNRPEP
jgi:predicted transport protein